MIGIVEWLIKVEGMAAGLYSDAAERFSGDKAFYSLLSGLSRDEYVHMEFMKKAEKAVKEGAILPGIVYIDRDSRERIEDFFRKSGEGLKGGGLTEAGMVEAIVRSELSEWNDWFLFIVNTLKEEHREFVPAVVKMQHHIRDVERFLAARPPYRGLLDEVRRLPMVWQERFLVVDDDAAISNVLSAILMDEGAVERVPDGNDALKKVLDRYYAVIVSDISLPHMSGIEFYKKAVEKYPQIKNRFIFFTGSMDKERSEFFRTTGARCLKKPFQIKDVKEAVIGILKR